MFSAKTDLFQELNSAIKRTWNNASADVLEQLQPPGESDLHVTGESFNHGSSSHVASFKRMKERIEALETLNDQLYQYLYFLVEHLPDLIRKTVSTDREMNGKFDDLRVSSRLKGNNNGALTDRCLDPFPTRREMDILNLLAKGLCAKEIAKVLYISETTVITHKKNLKKKYNVRNTVELISKVRNLKQTG
jgi:DNA-binding NarL/FixJ family response regulator